MSLDLSDHKLAGKKRGLEHLLSAAGYSLGGFRRMLGETAFRHELAAAAIVLVLFALRGAEVASYLTQGVLILVLMACEALNTAIEIIVDRVSPEISEFARHAKDLGSFAVFCLLAANGAYAASVLIAGA